MVFGAAVAIVNTYACSYSQIRALPRVVDKEYLAKQDGAKNKKDGDDGDDDGDKPAKKLKSEN